MEGKCRRHNPRVGQRLTVNKRSFRKSGSVGKPAPEAGWDREGSNAVLGKHGAAVQRCSRRNHSIHRARTRGQRGGTCSLLSHFLKDKQTLFPRRCGRARGSHTQHKCPTVCPQKDRRLARLPIPPRLVLPAQTSVSYLGTSGPLLPGCVICPSAGLGEHLALLARAILP